MTREEAIKWFRESPFWHENHEPFNIAIKALEQEPLTPKWCTDCREYDQEKHCCHRWSRAIRNTVEEMKQYYIERDVLDKIRAEIEGYKSTIDNAISEDELKIEGMKEAYADCLEIIDKYKAETEAEDGNEL